MNHTTLFGGAAAPRGARQARTPKKNITAPSAAAGHTLDLQALAVTLMRVAEAVEAREAKLVAALDAAAAAGDLRMVRRLAKRLGHAALPPGGGGDSAKLLDDPCG